MSTTTTKTAAHATLTYGSLILAIPTAVHALITLLALHLTADQVGSLDTLLGLGAAAVLLATSQNGSSTQDVQAAVQSALAAALAPQSPDTHEAGVASEPTPAPAAATPS